MQRHALGTVTVLTFVGVPASAFAGFTAGNLVVVRVNGTAGTAQAAYLEEFTTAPGQSFGNTVSSVALPTTAGANGNRRCALPGNINAAEGFLAMSTNRQYLTLACDDVAIGTTVQT